MHGCLVVSFKLKLLRLRVLMHASVVVRGRSASDARSGRTEERKRKEQKEKNEKKGAHSKFSSFSACFISFDELAPPFGPGRQALAVLLDAQEGLAQSAALDACTYGRLRCMQRTHDIVFDSCCGVMFYQRNMLVCGCMVNRVGVPG